MHCPPERCRKTVLVCGRGLYLDCAARPLNDIFRGNPANLSASAKSSVRRFFLFTSGKILFSRVPLPPEDNHFSPPQGPRLYFPEGESPSERHPVVKSPLLSVPSLPTDGPAVQDPAPAEMVGVAQCFWASRREGFGGLLYKLPNITAGLAPPSPMSEVQAIRWPLLCTNCR